MPFISEEVPPGGVVAAGGGVGLEEETFNAAAAEDLALAGSKFSAFKRVFADDDETISDEAAVAGIGFRHEEAVSEG
jgi:hypothetical protein